MMKFVFALALTLVSMTAKADVPAPVLPAFFEVTGVSSDDTLNVRAEPDVGAAIIGELNYSSNYIEILAHSVTGAWGRVNTGEQSGWVSMRYMQVMTDPIMNNGLPKWLRCSGTEPFWSIEFDGPDVVFSDPNIGESPVLHAITSMSPSPEYLDLSATGVLFRWTQDGLPITARILPGLCSDGMSDRAYGLHYIDNSSRYGCCSMSD